MRGVIAAILDVLATVVVAFAAFFLAYRLTPCTDVSECPVLAPVVIMTVLLCVGAYFGVGYRFLGVTPGKKLLKSETNSTTSQVEEVPRR